MKRHKIQTKDSIKKELAETYYSTREYTVDSFESPVYESNHLSYGWLEDIDGMPDLAYVAIFYDPHEVCIGYWAFDSLDAVDAFWSRWIEQHHGV